MATFRNGKLVNPVMEQRIREVEEVWAPQLPDIHKEVEERLRRVVPNRVRNFKTYHLFEIEYDENIQYAGQINKLTYKIKVGPLFFRETDENKKQTIMHEMAHVILIGFSKHTKGNREILRRAGIHAIANDAPELNEIYQQQKDNYIRRSNYAIKCINCGATSYRIQKSKVVQYPERFRCSKCGGKLVVISR